MGSGDRISGDQKFYVQKSFNDQEIKSFYDQVIIFLPFQEIESLINAFDLLISSVFRRSKVYYNFKRQNKSKYCFENFFFHKSAAVTLLIS
jgi:hypothetical protein